MTLGNNIQRMRKEANLSQEDLAEKFNVSRQTISNWENGKSYPDLETVVNISDSFNISLDILLKEDLEMVKTIDKEVRSTRKYAKALIAIGIVFVLLIGSFAVYAAVYFHTKGELEGNFEKGLKENNFYMNTDGYYSMDYDDGIKFSVPNQSMPGLMDFTLNFHLSNLYCNIELDDRYVEIIWGEADEFSASAVNKADESIIGSTSRFKEKDFSNMKKLSEELGISENEMGEIIEKGNELYKEFYPR